MGDANNIIIGPAAIQLDGTDIGFTKGGTTIKFTREYLDVTVDQTVGTVRKGRKAEKVVVNTSMLEITLERLRIAWDQPSANYTTTYLYLGYDYACNIETHTLRLTGTSPACGVRTFYLYKVVSVGEADYKMSREEETALAVEFEALKDSANNNKFGWVHDS